jgi:hypothetical protein
MQAQTGSNLDLIYNLIDSSVVTVTENLEYEDVVYHLEFTSPPEYNLLKNRVQSSFGRKRSFTEDKSKSLKSIKYNLESVKVNYDNIFKDGLFGSYKVERQIGLNGNYITLYKDQSIGGDTFSYTYSDTVDYDKVNELESLTLAFTRAQKPGEPLLPSLLEPAIAIGAIAITIILFFTVRSN